LPFPPLGGRRIGTNRNRKAKDEFTVGEIIRVIPQIPNNILGYVDENGAVRRRIGPFE
jgi:hypothetical protein